MNFQVPQFIEQKPKIVGFLTLFQFLYLAGVALLGYVSFYVFNFFLALIITVFAGLVGLALAFVKINGQEFPRIVIAVFSYLWNPKIYVWQRQTLQSSVNIKEMENLRNKMGLQEKLKSVALNITTGKFFSRKQKAGDEEKYETVVFLTGERKTAKRVDY